MFANRGITEFSVDKHVCDRPDIVVHTDATSCGIEICRLDYEDYCRWQAVSPGTTYSRAAEITLDLAQMLKRVMDLKRDKHQSYKDTHNLEECWLVLHNNLFKFPEVASGPGVPDRRWFEKNSHFELHDLHCPFELVLFNLEDQDCWYTLFDKNVPIVRDCRVTQWPTVILSESAVVTQRGNNVVDLSNALPREHFP